MGLLRQEVDLQNDLWLVKRCEIVASELSVRRTMLAFGAYAGAWGLWAWHWVSVRHELERGAGVCSPEVRVRRWRVGK